MSAPSVSDLAQRRAEARLDAEDAAVRDEPSGLTMGLRQLREKALADLTNPRRGALLDWVFLHAQAKGEEAQASRMLRRVEDQESMIFARAASLDSRAAQALTLEHMMDPVGFAKYEAAYAEAVARVAATERVIGLLARRNTAAPKAVPPRTK